MKRIELVIENCKKGNEFKYHNFAIETEEELRDLLISQDCPSWFGVDDLSPREQDCDADSEKCKRCWNGEVL